ncbi:MAG: hypothetical protein EXS13_00950 [Planctomycetes bacterium]|nr:hypothetical protein [Planctomycetota bacterium]
MDLHRVGTIFRKELLDTLRDRKTLFFMLALPTLLMPGLIALMSRVTQSEAKKTQERRLTVQAEPDERDRLLGFLRNRLEGQRSAVDQFLALLGPSVRAPLDAIAADLGSGSAEVLLTIQVDPRVRAHPRFAELATAFKAAGDGMLKDESTRVALDDPAATRAMREVNDLLNPLVTIDFVSAQEAKHCAATHPPAPLDELPAKIRGDERRLAAAQAVAERRIHAAVTVPRALDAEIVERDDQVAIEILYDSTIDLSQEAQRRIEAAVVAGGRLTTEARLAREQLPATFVAPVDVEPLNCAARSKQVLKVIAGILPYLLILMCFVGGLYPATDLGAGEKERLTLETLLVSPAARSEIALGKFAVVFLSALIAGLAATGSMAWTFSSGLAGKELGALLHFDLSLRQIAVCLALIAPMAAVFSAVMLSLSLYAKSQKEAQSLMMPLQFLIIIPAMLSMIPTIELNKTFACVPVLNVALGLRSVLTAGGAELPWVEIAIIFGSTALTAAAALAWCSWWFSQEKVIFRS